MLRQAGAENFATPEKEKGGEVMPWSHGGSTTSTQVSWESVLFFQLSPPFQLGQTNGSAIIHNQRDLTQRSEVTSLMLQSSRACTFL